MVDVTALRANANSDLESFDQSSTDYLNGMTRTLAGIFGGPEALISALQAGLLVSQKYGGRERLDRDH